eukprot:81887_1
MRNHAAPNRSKKKNEWFGLHCSPNMYLYASNFDLSYNKLGEYEYSQNIEVRDEWSVDKLRTELAIKLNENPDELVIRYNYHDQELNDQSKTLSEYGISKAGTRLKDSKSVSSKRHIYIEKGTPFKTGKEYRFSIFVDNELNDEKLVFGYIYKKYDRKNKDIKRSNIFNVIPTPLKKIIFKFYFIRKHDAKLNFVGDVILLKDMKIIEAKKAIFNKFGSKITSSFELMRLRHILTSYNADSLANIYLDDVNLEQNAKKINGKIKDFMQICCQRISEREKLTKDYILLSVAKAYKIKSKWMIEEFIEIAFRKTETISNVKKIICENIANELLEHYESILIQPLLLQNFNKRTINSYCSKRGYWTFLDNDDKLSKKISYHYRLRTGDILMYAKSTDIY